jgi:hypothetical protein
MLEGHETQTLTSSAKQHSQMIRQEVFQEGPRCHTKNKPVEAEISMNG